MQLKCRTVVHLGLGKFSSQCENFAWQIVLRVCGGKQNARYNRHSPRSCSDIGTDRLIDGWAGELEKTMIHFSPESPLLDELHETHKFTDSFRIPAAVAGDNNVVVRCL